MRGGGRGKVKGASLETRGQPDAGWLAATVPTLFLTVQFTCAYLFYSLNEIIIIIKIIITSRQNVLVKSPSQGTMSRQVLIFECLNVKRKNLADNLFKGTVA